MAILKGTSVADTLRGTSSADTIAGLAGNDLLYGLGGADNIDGGSGNDKIQGGAGADEMYGGTGSDIFVYTSVSDSPFIPTYDVDFIRDWTAADTIDLSGIDANSMIVGNQAFQFAGYFYGTPVGPLGAGQLAIAGFGGELYIVANSDADAAWDLCISLWSAVGESGLSVSDLIL